MEIQTDQIAETINDLRDKYFENIPLSHEEKQALSNFDQYRILKLNNVQSDSEYKNQYLKLQAMANLASYRKFLDISVTSALKNS